MRVYCIYSILFIYCVERDGEGILYIYSILFIYSIETMRVYYIYNILVYIALM